MAQRDRHGKAAPDGWRHIRVGELVAEARTGFACGERDPDGVVQLRMNNVDTRGNLVWDEFIRVPATPEMVDAYRLRPGDVLFNNTNSVELVGKSALFQGYDEPVVFSNHFTRLRTQEALLEPAFLAAWLNHEWHQGTFAAICNRWIGQSAVKADKLLSLGMTTPGLNDQKRIASLLAAHFAAIERARRAATCRDQTAAALPAAYVRQVFDSEAAQAWTRRRLLDICHSKGQYGTSRKSNGMRRGLPVLGMSHIFEGRIRWENVWHVELTPEDEAKYLLHSGDLLFNRTNSAELVGKTAVFESDQPAVFASYLIRFQVATDAADARFVSAYINSPQGRAFIERHMARAIGQVNISASTMHEMPIPTPGIGEQRRIAEQLDQRIEAANKLRDIVSEAADAVDALLAALLRRVFAGGL